MRAVSNKTRIETFEPSINFNFKKLSMRAVSNKTRIETFGLSSLGFGDSMRAVSNKTRIETAQILMVCMVVARMRAVSNKTRIETRITEISND